MSSVQQPEYASLAVLFVTVTWLIGIALKHILQTRKFPLPYTALLLLVGVIWGSSRQFKYPGTLGKSAISLSNINPFLIFQIFLPALIFQSAFEVNIYTLRKILVQALIMAGPVVVFSMAMIAPIPVLVFKYKWEWNLAFLFGTSLSTTDPVAVVAILREVGVSERLRTLIEAESLLNDGSAFVLYYILLESVTSHTPSVSSIIGFFFQLSVGGAFLGFVTGWIFSMWLKRVFNDVVIETCITLVAAYLVFWIAESSQLFHVSGVISVVTLGFTMSRLKTSITPEVEKYTSQFWEVTSFLANTLIFVLAGDIVASKLFVSSEITYMDFLFSILLFVWINVVRVISILLVYPILKKTGYGMSWRSAVILTNSALRGAVSLALALITELHHNIDPVSRSQMSFLVCMIVLLTLTVNGTFAKPLLDLLGLNEPTPASSLILKKTLDTLLHDRDELISVLKKDQKFKSADWLQVRKLLPAYIKIREEANGYPETRQENQTPSHRTLLIREVSERKDLIVAELNKRMLLSLKSSYMRQFEEGLLSREATDFLLAVVEYSLDEELILVHWNLMQPKLRFPKWLKRAYRSYGENTIIRDRITNHVILVFEIIAAFLQALHDATKVLHHRLLYEQWTVQMLHEEVEEYAEQARELQRTIQVTFPELYKMTQTRRALGYVLNKERSEVLDMYLHAGVLEEVEKNRMLSLLEKRIFNLTCDEIIYFKSARISSAVVFCECSSFSSVRYDQLLRLFQKSIKLLFDQGEVVVKPNQKRLGIYFVSRGTVDVTKQIAGEILFSVNQGELFGCWNCVSGEPSSSYFQARTFAEVFLLPADLVLSTTNSNQQFGEDIWHAAAIELVQTEFAEYFSGVTDWISMLSRGVFQRVDSRADIHVYSGGILLQGILAHASNENGSEDEKIGEEAPLLIFPSTKFLGFRDDSLLLVFKVADSEWHCKHWRMPTSHKCWPLYVRRDTGIDLNGSN